MKKNTLLLSTLFLLSAGCGVGLNKDHIDNESSGLTAQSITTARWSNAGNHVNIHIEHSNSITLTVDSRFCASSNTSNCVEYLRFEPVGTSFQVRDLETQALLAPGSYSLSVSQSASSKVMDFSNFAVEPASGLILQVRAINGSSTGEWMTASQ